MVDSYIVSGASPGLPLCSTAGGASVDFPPLYNAPPLSAKDTVPVHIQWASNFAAVL